MGACQADGGHEQSSRQQRSGLAEAQSVKQQGPEGAINSLAARTLSEPEGEGADSAGEVGTDQHTRASRVGLGVGRDPVGTADQNHARCRGLPAASSPGISNV